MTSGHYSTSAGEHPAPASMPRPYGELIDSYQQRGYAVVENMLERTELDEALEWIDSPSQGKAVERSDRYGSSGRIDFVKIPNLARRSEAFRALACSQGLVAAVEALLGRPALLFRDVLVAKPARDGASFTYHQDSEYWDVEPRALVSAWIPFRDVGPEDGCLRVIAGSHRRQYRHDLLLGERALPSWTTAILRKMASLSGTGDSDASGVAVLRSLKRSLLGKYSRRVKILASLQELHARVPEGDRANETSLPVKAGSAILFHSNLLHASYPNSSGRDRLAYIASYMGDDYLFLGVGTPEFLIVSERGKRVFKKARTS